MMRRDVEIIFKNCQTEVFQISSFADPPGASTPHSKGSSLYQKAVTL
jgi:hypothetical protein